MTTVPVFVQQHGSKKIFDAVFAEKPEFDEIIAGLEKLGIQVCSESFVFIDDADTPLGKTCHIGKLKPGVRIHVCKCRFFDIEVNFAGETANRRFPPGARLRAVKRWAARQFSLDRADAAEHVLEICGGADRPSSDTPLHELRIEAGCALCFDLVPEKRVEG